MFYRLFSFINLRFLIPCVVFFKAYRLFLHSVGACSYSASPFFHSVSLFFHSVTLFSKPNSVCFCTVSLFLHTYYACSHTCSLCFYTGGLFLLSVSKIWGFVSIFLLPECIFRNTVFTFLQHEPELAVEYQSNSNLSSSSAS